MIYSLLSMLIAMAETPADSGWTGLERAVVIILATVAFPFIVWGIFRIPYLVASKAKARREGR
ncbi:MAG: hypothetical protein EA376_06565 [Phycisphaeraceae bacterium]|nr:MAG: hypothetical protein EA376_06565 [Phycisphaeraceae bacterium]